MNRCVRRFSIPWTLNLGCAKSLELTTKNEIPVEAKKQASEGTSFNDDGYGQRIMEPGTSGPSKGTVPLPNPVEDQDFPRGF